MDAQMDSQKSVVDEAPAPLFKAVTSSTRPLYQLLKCISFSPKLHVEITPSGLRFSADNSRVMQGVAHWNKGLFSSYNINLPPAQDGEDEDSDEVETPNFQISLPALLETLQIFGAADAAVRKAEPDAYKSNIRNYKGAEAFMANGSSVNLSPDTCSLSYNQPGEPFSIMLEESGVKTACNLVTYVPEIQEDIPFETLDVSFKIIMQSRYFLDALAEIAPTSPDKLTIVVSRNAPYLRLSSSGALGGSSVDFAKAKDLLETFSVRQRWVQTFKFDFIKSATEAMRIASKISIRGDAQGVLSMQFMVEVEGAGNNFLDFRFVPYAVQDESEDEEEGDGDEEEAE